MTKKFTVIGAGLAGLLAGAILRDECESILESQSDLPNNHSALLRFKTSVVGDAVNIPFRPVDVLKVVQSIGNPVADAISYSLKTNGTARLRSIITAQGATERRFIAPADFIPRLRAKVTAGIAFDVEWYGKSWEREGPVISTIPMPVLAKMLDYHFDSVFGSVVGFAITAKLKDTDLCATVYIPKRESLAYRASITGDTLIVEYAFPNKTSGGASEAMKNLVDYPKNLSDHLHEILQMFGMGSSHIVGVPKIKQQAYSKILPIDDDERKRFILWASEKHNIYSFGRFATWRPGLLMDDLINDLRIIQRIANGGSTYNARK